ncbi:MAG: hypothetical protein ACTH2K_07240 [Candidatus Corynebacterium faecigallinarum]
MSDLDTLLGVGRVILMYGAAPLLIVAAVLVVFHRDEMDNAASNLDDGRRMGNVAATASGLGVGVLLWLAWFSWNDPIGALTWPIVAAVISALVAVIGLGLLTRWKRTGPLFVALGGLFGFSSSFAVDAGFYDDTGMWGVGYLILLVCAGLALAVIASGVVLLRTRTSSSPTG